MFIDAAEKYVAIKQFNSSNSISNYPLVILISDLDLSKNNTESPYGYKYLSGSNVTVTYDNNENLIYTLTTFDEGNNAIIGQTLETLNELGTGAVVNITPDEANITLPRKFAVGDNVILKGEGGSFTVIKAATASEKVITLFADYVLKTDSTEFDTSCVGTSPYCSTVQFDNNAYDANLNLSSITPDNIGYYLTNYQNNLRTKYNDNTITVDLPTLQTLLDLTNILSLDTIRENLNKTGTTKDLNIEPLNLNNIDILFKGQNYWFNSIWVDIDSGRNWYWYVRDSYGKVIDAYWTNHGTLCGFRPIIIIPVEYIN